MNSRVTFIARRGLFWRRNNQKPAAVHTEVKPRSREERFKHLTETPRERLRRIQQANIDKNFSGLLYPHMTDDNFEIVGDKVYRVDPNAPRVRKSLSVDFLAKLHKRYDISLQGFMRWLRLREQIEEDEAQKFNPTRHAILGPELAAASFILGRGGKCTFHGDGDPTKDIWWTDEFKLPPEFDERFKIKKLIAGPADLNYNGLDNISNLRYCELLDVSESRRLNEFCFDKIYRQFRYSRTLEELIVRKCPGFTHRALEAVYRIPTLKRIDIRDTPAARYRSFHLIQFLLHDIKPDLEIIR